MIRSAFLPFSPQYDFVAYRPGLKIDGVEYEVGQMIDKSKISERRLMQLYTMRSIVPAGFADSPKPAYLENGRGKADQLRKEIEREEGEGKDAASVPTAKSGADAKKPAAAASPAAAKTVGSKPAAKPSKSPRARRAA
ncbi:MAG: hypothetical protein KJZ75_11210 [Hyphomonadaceae bacterium]|nr:hypothetical protein [Hyphomonadaceae bacterium]